MMVPLQSVSCINAITMTGGAASLGLNATDYDLEHDTERNVIHVTRKNSRRTMLVPMSNVAFYVVAEAPETSSPKKGKNA